MSNDIPTPEEKAKYDAAKKELLQALAKKRNLDKQLVRRAQFPSEIDTLRVLILLQALIEVQIYNLEGSYLTETAAHSGGNIIHGFDGYFKNQPSGRRKYEISEQDRIFSTSSMTYKKVRGHCPVRDCDG